MITLRTPPRLVDPTTTVRTSYLTGEQADMLHRGTATDWLGPASEDFDAFVTERVGVRERWGVPSTVYWYVSDEHYLGTLVVRHRLTHDEGGGHIGYHVVFPWQHQGHATRMLAEGLLLAREHDIDRALLTVDPANTWSQRVVLANGGERDGQRNGEDRFWMPRVADAAAGSPAARRSPLGD